MSAADDRVERAAFILYCAQQGDMGSEECRDLARDMLDAADAPPEDRSLPRAPVVAGNEQTESNQ